MAKPKGVISLKDTVPDSEIVRLGEVRNKPDYAFPDGEYGITGKYRDYSLVSKRIAYRTGTEEDGINIGKVIEYELWEDIPCYCGTITSIFESYAKMLNLTEFKSKKMKGEISELVDIHRRTYNMISEALSGIDTYLSKEQLEVCELADVKQRLLNDISELKQQKNEIITLIDEINKMYLAIKEKHKIIVDDNKPKYKKSKESE